MKTMIVGAGLTGLILGNHLQNSSLDGSSVSIIEKSRGVGGRMATRRTDTSRFDHGAQFYARREPLEACHQLWHAQALTSYWFDRQRIEHFNAPGGMTSLAKMLLKDLSVKFEKKLIAVTRMEAGWKLELESAAESFLVERLILTSPLPQSLEILKRSAIAYDPALDQIEYSKALVALIEPRSPSEKLSGESGYLEFDRGAIYSVADQLRKGVSPVPAYTVTFAAEMSEKLFEDTDDVARVIAQTEIARLDPEIEIKSIQLKRWRYNRPLRTYGSLFYEVAPSLFLAGDAFGGASLNGAARSASALGSHLISMHVHGQGRN